MAAKRATTAAAKATTATTAASWGDSWRGRGAVARVRAILAANGDRYGAEAELLRAPALDCDEATFQTWVESLLEFYGWEWFHDQDARRNRAGLPDLVFVGGGRTYWRELKTATGRLESAQRRWRDQLLAAGQDWRLWRPGDTEDIIATVRDGIVAGSTPHASTGEIEATRDVGPQERTRPITDAPEGHTCGAPQRGSERTPPTTRKRSGRTKPAEPRTQRVC